VTSGLDVLERASLGDVAPLVEFVRARSTEEEPAE